MVSLPVWVGGRWKVFRSGGPYLPTTSIPAQNLPTEGGVHALLIPDSRAMVYDTHPRWSYTQEERGLTSHVNSHLT